GRSRGSGSTGWPAGQSRAVDRSGNGIGSGSAVGERGRWCARSGQAGGLGVHGAQGQRRDRRRSRSDPAGSGSRPRRS
ncbi:MAG: hypothetical protein ACK56F_08765, partial [bacterium]